jgi:hypothetical protein
MKHCVPPGVQDGGGDEGGQRGQRLEFFAFKSLYYHPVGQVNQFLCLTAKIKLLALSRRLKENKRKE